MELVAWGLTTLVSAFIGSFLAGYLKRKGENLATHEDIDKLVEQVAAVTHATKEIEAQISDTVWSRQKRWEVKKDAVVELIAALSEITEALTLLDATFRASAGAEGLYADAANSNKEKALTAWSRGSANFSRAMLLAELVCGQEVKSAMNTLNLRVRQIVSDVIAGKAKGLSDALVLLVAHQNLLLAAIREDLGIEAVPQSSTR